MPLPTKMTDLSISAGSNYPAGSESRALADDYLRAIQTIIRLEQSQAASVASAATVDLGAIASGNYVHITGTTTITSLGTVSAGITRTVVFDGALTLTHNATSLILPGGASIVTAVGDAAKFVSEGGGNWRCINYERANISATNYAAAGANSDITSLSALPLAIATAGTTQASALTALGAVLNGVLSKSANYPIVAADRGKLIDYTAAPYTVTLPAVSVGDGFVIGLRNSAGSGALTVGRNTANINGAAADITLAPGESCLIVCDGSGWKTVGKTTTPVTSGTILTKAPLVFGTTTSQAHNLGQEPSYIRVVLECVTGENGWVSGDRIDMSTLNPDSNAASFYGINVYADATNVYLKIYDGIYLFSKNSSAGSLITAANWKIICYPYKFS